MKVSYNWLKQYVNIDLPIENISVILTDCGLEVEGIEKFESIKGGLEGFVVGKVITKEKHPDADKLSLTKVDVGTGTLLDIVCGAPNVDAGQKVIVATLGTKIYSDKGDFEIKKSKIRGAISEGMLCAEDELGMGESHSGIMVLPENTEIGTLAKDYFKIENDYTIEIGLTPNRIDAASHLGVARDLVAALNSIAFNEKTTSYCYTKPDVSKFAKDNDARKIEISIEDTIACPRYTGLTLTGVIVKESPEWLQNRLKAIGQKPINNIVDITNYILNDLGQPLHAFDADKIKGNKVIIKKASAGTKFYTLDNVERELTANDLMICNTEVPMCIAGVFGGIESGVSNATTSIFLESAYFNPVSVRKTSKYHGLKTDASFRFERGTDPNCTIYAIKYAALLIKEIAGGTISSDIIDIYPEPVQDFEVQLDIARMNTFIGHVIPLEQVKTILTSLDIQIVAETDGILSLKVPTYRVDVQRDVDVIEEILRIYGYNNIPMPQSLHASVSYAPKPDVEKIRNMVADMMTSVGYYEFMNNSLTASSYYELLEEKYAEKHVKILNPLSKELDVLRQTLLFGGLESISHNINRKNPNIKAYEFGKTYSLKNKEAENVTKKYEEIFRLGIWITGDMQSESWNNIKTKTDLFQLKNTLNNIFKKSGVPSYSLKENESDAIYSYSISIILENGKELARFGAISTAILKKMDIKQDVFFGDINFDEMIKAITKHKVSFKEISKYPEVRRDLALLLDKEIKFAKLEEIAKKTEKKLIKKVDLFDVYEGEKLPEGKKSYALSFILQDEQQTLTDNVIEKVMDKLIKAYQSEISAQIR